MIKIISKISLFFIILLQSTVAFAQAKPVLNSGDASWMLTSTALVLLMTIPGLALFYGGLVGKKNVVSTISQSFMITCIVTLMWFVCGYSLTFGEGNLFIGDFSKNFPQGCRGCWFDDDDSRVSIRCLSINFCNYYRCTDLWISSWKDKFWCIIYICNLMGNFSLRTSRSYGLGRWLSF